MNREHPLPRKASARPAGFPESIIEEGRAFRTAGCVFRSAPGWAPLDDLDRKILQILKANARESFVHIAEALGTSEGTIRARIKRLTDEGIIRKFTVQTAGSNIKAMIEVRIETNVNSSAVSSQIATWEGVERVWEVTGEQDIVVVVDVESTAELNDIVDRIRMFKETQATRSRLILREC